MLSTSKFPLLAVIMLLLPARSEAATRYAKTNGVITGNCDTWANACSLAGALTVAASGDSIWVQSGTYGTIELKNAVKMIGGFAGTETQASQSNPASNVTTIDGNSTSRAVLSRDNGPSTILRGFKIINGQTGDDFEEGGGGLYLENSSTQIVQCVFENNQAIRFGAAVSIHGSGSPEFVNCDFQNNGTGSGTSVQPLAGGAVYLHSGSPRFTNCLFYNNKAGEGTVIANFTGSATVVNCTLVNNQATIGYGGGIFDKRGAVQVRNSILWGNTAIRGGSQIQNRDGVVSSVTNSNVQGGWTGTGNVSADPLFVNPSSGDYKLQDSSPCKNTGSNSALPIDVTDLDWDNNLSEEVPKDLAFGQRKIGVNVDMGAYESPLGTGLD